MGISLREIKSFLESLPCVREESRGHTKYILKVNGRVVAWTNYSRSWRDSTQIDDSMVSKMGREMRCSNSVLWRKLLARQEPKDAYFRDLLEHSHISREEYDTLCEKGRPPKRK